MKNFILGFILGSIIFGVGVAYATVAVLYNSNNQEVGTDANPLYVEVI